MHGCSTSKAMPFPICLRAAVRRQAFRGKAGALGYASGNGLLTAIALGRLAGRAAAREIAQT